MDRPKAAVHTRTAVKLLIPSGYIQKNGVRVPAYPPDGDTIMVNWKSYGGTETTVNGVFSILDTAQITARYRPDITAKCRLLRADGAVYEIKNEPEDVDLGKRYLIFKVERVKGGA